MTPTRSCPATPVPPPETPPVTRPLVNPALATLWRDDATVQIGTDPDRAIVVGGLDAGCSRLLRSLDGTRTRDAVLSHAPRLGVSPVAAADLLDLLGGAGVLADAASDRRCLAALSAAERDRLAPDLASMSLVHGADAAAQVLAHRRRAAVRVVGAGRLGSTLAVLLAAAGVGRVVPEDTSASDRGDLPAWSASSSGAGGPGSTREDRTRSELEAAVPSVRSRRSRRRPAVDLVVLVAAEAGSRRRDPAGARAGTAQAPWQQVADEATRTDVPLLHVTVRETTGIVGPLVVPGVTSCLRCQDFHRAERDPAWPRVAAQLARDVGRAAPCDVVLATATAAVAAMHALAWVDGQGARLPSSADATLEIALPEGRLRRRPWAPHPSCGCGWPRTG